MVSERSGARTALVTGALGGIGQAIVHRLASSGMNLVLTDLTSCASLAAEIAQSGITVLERPCDLADDNDIAGLLDWIESTGMQIDVLINNAADQRLAPIETLGIDQLRTALRINVEAPFLLARSLGLRMAARGWGRIVNVVSGAPWSPPPGFSAYVTTKMALIGLTRSMAVELGDRGVTVNAASPALTVHANNAHALPDQIWDAQRQKQAIKRTARPADFVGLIAFLCSDDAEFVTGQTMFSDGGGLML